MCIFIAPTHCMLQQQKASNPRRPTNLSIDSGLLDEAKSLGINVSRSAETGLADAIRKAKQQAWLAENQSALDSSNDFVERNSLPLASYRNF